MKFSKLSLAAGILLGITGLVSCGGVKQESKPVETTKAVNEADNAHITTSEAGCPSLPHADPQESTPPVTSVASEGEIAKSSGGCPSTDDPSL